jgi:hypothetical protein
MITVKGYYDKGVFTTTEPVPAHQRYEVYITFVKPAFSKEKTTKNKKKLLDSLVGIAAGNTMTLDDIRAERLARQ